MGVGEHRRRSARPTLPSALLAAALAIFACSPASPPGPSVFSLLAIGDFGAPPSDPVDYPRMCAVTRAMANEDRERPVDLVLLLGDNFYPSGLAADALERRVAANVLGPFCHFAATDGPDFGRIARFCPSPLERRHPVPLVAVLGNHDYDTAESPALQQEAVARFVSNWTMRTGAGVAEFDAGVSVIHFDSEAIAAGAELRPLVEALTASRGPWRILAGHRPMAIQGHGDQRQDYARYTERIRSALAEADVPVQLVLSGHEHRLAILQMPPPDPPLHVVSGGGSNRRKSRATEPHARVEYESLGFARVDLIGEGDDARLWVSLVRVHRYGWVRAFAERRFGPRFSVDLQGVVETAETP